MPRRMRRVTSGPKPRERVASYIPRKSVALDAQPVPHSVEPREVRRRLGRRDDVVDLDREARVRQRDVAHLGAERLS